MRALYLRQIIEIAAVELYQTEEYADLHRATEWCHGMEKLFVEKKLGKKAG